MSKLNMASEGHLALQEPEIGEDDTRRKMDPEVRIIGQMIRILDEVDVAARARIVAYIRDRYSPVGF